MFNFKLTVFTFGILALTLFGPCLALATLGLDTPALAAARAQAPAGAATHHALRLSEQLRRNCARTVPLVHEARCGMAGQSA